MDSENERIKLKATFWNDLAVAATASGIVIPILGSYHDDVSWNSTVFPVFSDIAKRLFVGAHPGHYHRGGFACLCELSNDETSRLGLNPPRFDLAAALGTEHEKGNYKALFAADASALKPVPT